jgi:hypothetical protein
MSSAEVSVGSAAAPRQAVSAPQDDVSNHGNFKVIDSTLREGELYRNASFDTGKAWNPLFVVHDSRKLTLNFFCPRNQD